MVLVEIGSRGGPKHNIFSLPPFKVNGWVYFHFARCLKESYTRSYKRKNILAVSFGVAFADLQETEHGVRFGLFRVCQL